MTRHATFEMAGNASLKEYSTAAADEAILCPICGRADALDFRLSPRTWRAECTRCRVKFRGRWPKRAGQARAHTA